MKRNEPDLIREGILDNGNEQPQLDKLYHIYSILWTMEVEIFGPLDEDTPIAE